PGAVSLRAEASLENPRQIHRRDTRTGVAELDDRGLVFQTCANFELAASRRVAKGVQRQVQKYLLQLTRIAVDLGIAEFKIGPDFNFALLRQGRNETDCAPQDRNKL